MINKEVFKHFQKFKKITQRATKKTGFERESGFEYSPFIQDSEREYLSLMSSLLVLIETGTKFTLTISENEFVNRDFQLNKM